MQIQNIGTQPVRGPLWLVLDDLGADVTVLNAAGTSSALAPLGSPYVRVPLEHDGVLRPFETKTVALEFADPARAAIDYEPRVLNVTPAP